MQYTNTLIALATVAVSSAQSIPAVTATPGQVLKVKVGADGLKYTPSNIIAEVGTQIEFDFFPKNHTVTQSNFKDPCQPLASGGFFSGFVPTKPDQTGNSFTITVTDSKPIWFYCSQTTGTHCQAGMVGAINAAQSGNATLDAFISLAKNAPASTFPSGGPKGGVLNIASGNTSSSSATTTVAPTTVLTTSAILSTYTSNSQIYTTTVGSSTVPVGTGSSPSPTSSSITPVNSASGISANMALVGAILFGVLAFM